MGVNAALWRLDPSIRDYTGLMNQLKNPVLNHLFRNQFRWPEMQLATLYWSGQWNSIDLRFCSIGGFPDIQVLFGIRFAGLKLSNIHNPSILHYADFSDFKLWYE